MAWICFGHGKAIGCGRVWCCHTWLVLWCHTRLVLCCHTRLDRVSGFICNVSLVDATRERFLRFIPWYLEYRYEMMSFMRYQGMVYWFRSLVGSFCNAKLVVLYSACVVLSYPAWPGISVIMRQIQIPFYFRWFWYCTVERKNSCFIAQRCLNRYIIEKLCTNEQRN